MNLLTVFIYLNCIFIIQAKDLATCCYASRSKVCKRACQKLVPGYKHHFRYAYVSRRLAEIVDVCPRSEKYLRNCLTRSDVWKDFRNEALRKRFRYSYCCRDAKHISCEIKCLVSWKNRSIVNDESCNAVREPKLTQCLKRLDYSDKCCSKSSGKCQENCLTYFSGYASPQILTHKTNLENSCGKHSATYKCAMKHSDIEHVLEDYTSCCSKHTTSTCQQRCKEILSKSQNYDKMFQELQEPCGAFDIQVPMYKCLLQRSTQPKANNDPKVAKTEQTQVYDKGSETFKRQCCNRAKSEQCKTWCVSTITQPNLMGLWDTMYLTCIQNPKEAEMSSCMSDILEPCELGGKADLKFCTSFNNRPLESFRRCNNFGDSSALRLFTFWSSSIIPVLNYKLIFKDLRACHSEKFKAMACIISVKPCNHQTRQRQVCRKDCEQLIDECLDRKLTNIEINIKQVCETILPNANQTDCISVMDYTNEVTLDVNIEKEVTVPCRDNPCTSGEVCTINQYCYKNFDINNQKCELFKCVKGCAVSPRSNLITPVGQLAKLIVADNSLECYEVCRCKMSWISSEKEPLYHFGECEKFGCHEKRNCSIDGKIYKDGEIYQNKCNTCTCVDGEKICTTTDCPVNYTNLRPRRHHDHDGSFSHAAACNCGKSYEPVCGPNGMTFPNICHAKCCKMDDRSLNVGDCQKVDPCNPDPCSKKSLICVPTRRTCLSPSEPCQQYQCNIKSPNHELIEDTECHTSNKVESFVCGFDGVTYENICYAEKSGTGFDYYGPCKPNHLQGVYMAERCSKIQCPSLTLSHCPRIIPPGSCCPVCGSVLRVIYSQRELKRRRDFVSVESFTLGDVLTHMRQLLKVRECRLYAHIINPGELIFLILVHTKRPTHNQFIACRTEAQRFHNYINQKSPIVTTNYYLSFLKAARLKSDEWIPSSDGIIIHKQNTKILIILSTLLFYLGIVRIW